MKRREQLARFWESTASGIASDAPASAAALLWERRHDPDVARLYDGWIWSLPLRLFASPWTSLPRALGARSRYRHPDQQPIVYFPFLESQPWWPRDEAILRLEAEHAAIADEFRRIEAEVRAHPEAFLVEDGDWSTLDLFRHGRRFDRRCELCPRTTALLESMPLCTDAGGMAYFSVMAPGTRVSPHHGFTNTRVRYHLGVETGPGARFRVSDEMREWETGRAFAFDDSYRHEVRHEGATRRVVLLFDCWHPQLTIPERALIRELFAHLDLPRRS